MFLSHALSLKRYKVQITFLNNNGDKMEEDKIDFFFLNVSAADFYLVVVCTIEYSSAKLSFMKMSCIKAVCGHV